MSNSSLGIAVVVIASLSVVLLAKNLFIDNPVVFRDEYLYKVSADRRLDHAQVIARELSPALPNSFYFWVYGVCSAWSPNAYAIAQGLNVVFWALGLLFLYLLALELGLPAHRARLYLFAAALLPLSAFTKYFMPDSMYFGLFCASVYALMLGVLRRTRIHLAIAGVVLGLMYFVKPHALVLVLANLAFLMLSPGRLRSGALFFAGFVVAFGLGKWVSPAVSGSGLGFYREVLDEQLGVLAQASGLGATLLKVTAGHALYFLSSFGLVVLLAVCLLIAPLRAGPLSAPVRALTLYVWSALTLLAGMSVVFTTLGNEVGRIHSRYYFFLFPLALMALFHLPSVKLSAAGRVAGAVLVGGGAVAMMVFAPGYSATLPISTVSDSPEWGFVFFSRGLFYVVTASFAAASVWAIFRPEKFGWAVAVLCVASMLSSADVAMKQQGIFRNHFATGREASAAEELVGRAEMGRAVVVGVERGITSKFLFWLSSTPWLEHLAEGGSVEPVLAKFPEATRLILLSETYVVPASVSCAAIPPVRVCTIAR